MAKRRLEALIDEIELPLGEKEHGVSAGAKARRRPRELSVGTTLLRRWRGREIGVRVLEDGYEHDGVLYRSLSAVAKAVTGSHWNGRLFFGVTKRKKAR